MSGVLFFDLARRTGFAHDGDGPGTPVAGVIELPRPVDDDFGPVYSALRRKASALIYRCKPRVVGFESAVQALDVMRGKDGKPKTNARTKRLLHGYVSTIECLAADLGIECRETAAITIKKFLTGNGHADKAAMMRMCRALGWDFGDDDNAADACAGWGHLSSLVDPAFSIGATPMFGRR